MTVVASIVLGADGSTTPSRLVSNDIDRKDFLARRRSMDCILIGGNTARTERYENTPAPLVVMTRNSEELKSIYKEATFLSCSPIKAISYCFRKFGSTVGVEVGPDLLIEMIRADLIDELHLTITNKTGATNPHTPEEFLEKLQVISDEDKEGTRLIVARKQK